MQALGVGIYTITCANNSKVYVGQSINMKSRWYDHKKKLKAGTHYNKHMQAAYTKYGGSAFTYAVAVYCSQANLSFYEQLLADGFRKIGVTLFNVGDYLPSPAKGSKRPDNSARLLAIHSNPETKYHMLRGVRERAKRIKGTPEAIALATRASHSRIPKPPRLVLKRGSPELTELRSRIHKRLYAEGVLVPNYNGKATVRLDTGERFISETALAKSLGVTKQAVRYHLRAGKGVCKGVPISYADNNDSGAQVVKP